MFLQFQCHMGPSLYNFPSVGWVYKTLTGLLPNCPSDPRRTKGACEEVRNAGPALKWPWPPSSRRRNSLWRLCSSFSRLFTWACSCENNERLDKREKSILTSNLHKVSVASSFKAKKIKKNPYCEPFPNETVECCVSKVDLNTSSSH